LRGTLQEFSLGDILQLYQISGRTGIVRTWRNDSLTHLIFVDRGRISGAGADQWDLIDEIRQIEWLSADTRAQLESMREDGGTTGLSLIAKALLPPNAWENFSERQLERLVFPALLWDEGEFEAIVNQVPRVAPFRVNQSPQQLVLSAARWDEELASAERSGYTVDSRWVRTDQPQSTFAQDAEDHLHVLPLMTHPRTIEELAAAAGLSTLRVIDQIRQFSDAGLVQSQ
jgi:hypothetical protein